MEAHVSRLVSKISFFSYVVHAHQPPLVSSSMGDLLWSLTMSPEALYHGLCTRPPSLCIPDSHGCCARQKNLHLSAMCICRGCAFHPGYLPFASPSAVPQPAHASGSEADFWSPGPQPAGPDHPGQGVAQIKSLEVLLCPSQPPWPP